MAIKKLQGLDAIRRWVVKTFLKEKEQTGVMVNLPKKDFVDLNTSITAERLMRNGIDPNSIKSEDQVENIINQLNKPRVVSQGDPEFEGIMSKVTGKNVIEANFGKPFKEEIINMREPKRFFKGVEIRDPKFDENLPFDNDAEKLAEIKMSNEAYEQELEKEIKERIAKRNKESVKKFKEKMKEDPEDMADGGRIGLKKGMDRRTFMKIMGGLTALPVLGKFFKGAEVAAPVAEKAAEVASGAPTYFFDLVNKIKIFGKQRQTPSYKERVNEYNYTGKDGIEYELIEDLDTGEIMIKKDKMGVASSGDQSYDVIEDRTEMVFKKGQADETTKGTPVDEYEEYKVEFDADGTAADATNIDEISKSEIIKEVTEEAPSIKKAGGGIARMLGE
mgnify:CR=1 FL=1